MKTLQWKKAKGKGEKSEDEKFFAALFIFHFSCDLNAISRVDFDEF